ncbi:MAG TPA: bifunctional metallophosphatase/5'-nucleotidase [Sphingomicrobium sp.]
MTRLWIALALGLAGCAAQPVTQVRAPIAPAAPVEVQILAINDLHGNLEPPAPVEIVQNDGSKNKVQTGGVARLGTALTRLRSGKPNTVTVSAGDSIGASPLISAYYLDEPTITAMNLMKVEFNAVGNHEFDRGSDELKRIQNGGCTKFTRRIPCAVEPFRGAEFRYLAANVRQADGSTIFPGTGLKRFETPAGPITIGFIGMTLKETSTLVTPSGVKGLTFADEAATANALVPQLKAQGADAIVLLIHQGGKLSKFTSGNGCDGFSGDIEPVLAKVDPAITTVVSGHTHWAYVCKGTPVTGPGRLLTSAGKNGYFVTDLRLQFDPATHRLVAQSARNVIVGGGEQGEDAAQTALVSRYAAAIAPVASKVVGRLSAAAPRDVEDFESAAADLIADSMLAATRDARDGGAQLALVNATGIRVDLPAGNVRYKDAFAMMPFGNNLLVMTLTGEQLKRVLEQQYAARVRPGFNRPAALAPSSGFTYAVDMKQPEGSRVSQLRLNGKAIQPQANYRVVVNNFLASGGDGLSGFTAGTDVSDPGIIDIDAMLAWIADGRTPPKADRITLR